MSYAQPSPSDSSAVASGTSNMQVISVNVGRVREAEWKGKTFTTAIFKEAVGGRVQATPGRGLTSDGQANTENHGGELKALLAYPYEQYSMNTTANSAALARISQPKTGWMTVFIWAIGIASERLR